MVCDVELVGAEEQGRDRSAIEADIGYLSDVAEVEDDAGVVRFFGSCKAGRVDAPAGEAAELCVERPVDQQGKRAADAAGAVLG